MNDWSFIQQEQESLCNKLKVTWSPVEIDSLIAINDSIFSSTQPINGLRHPIHGTIEGWYLWSGGEIPQYDNDFFKPHHAGHLITMRPIILKYLGLPPGWRFQIDDNGHEDIWFDPSILEI
ncbi:MAG: hypothetical protein WDO71_20940 [Bacteroidota bacterium]